jgi:hypothetical protein
LSLYRLLAILHVLAIVALITVPAEAAPEEYWYETTIDGASTGYVREWMEEDADADGNIVSGSYTRMVAKRGRQLVRVELSERWVETLDGTPVSYHLTSRLSSEERELDLTVTPGNARLRISLMDEAVVSDVSLADNFLFPKGVRRLHVERGFVPGDSYAFSAFAPDFSEVASFGVSIVGAEQLEIMDATVDVHKLVIVSPLYGGLELHEWRDEKGLLWMSEIAGTGIAKERTTREKALAEKEALDILSSGAVPTNVSIRAPFRVDGALYEVWMDDADVAEFIVEDKRQSIEGRTERGVLVRIRRVEPTSDAVVRFPIRSTPMKDYLDGNPLMQTWHPRILGVASRQAWGTDQNSWETAKNIEHWVFQEVENKGFGTVFGSALEVLDAGVGDCSEHAVLATAMARSIGIPTRLVSGLTYYQEQFLYHMWIEVWTGDDWYALDPTLGDGSVDAMHFKFGESSAARGSVADLSVGILRVFNRLHVVVKEYAIEGKTIAPQTK